MTVLMALTSRRVLLVLFLVLIAHTAIPAFLQSSCPPAKYFGNQWPKNSKVYYDTANLDPATKSAVDQAASDWNTANQTNGSGVVFAPATAQNPANLVFSNTPTTIPGTSSTCTPNQNQGALTCTFTQTGTQNTSSAAIVFNKSATIPGNPPQNVYDPAASNYETFLQKVARHELGHTMGLGEQTACGTPNTVMNGGCGTNDVGNSDPTGITNCDQGMIMNNSAYGSGGGGGSPCLNGATASPSGNFTVPVCSPIIVDTEGEGFHLTSAAGGVMFDIAGNGHPVQIAWAATGFHNAFLALPGVDGFVHNGEELFGNFTPQPISSNPNGFLALAEFDKPENGGNGDGIIDEHDAIYSRLRLWIDENHDGISQPEELHTLAELGVYTLSLGYQQSQRTDQFGNQFRFKAQVNAGIRRDRRDEASEVGRWMYDVFLQ
jgi:hypothetical protein